MTGQTNPSIPVHCIVEQIAPQGQSVDLSQTAGALDNYAIIPSNTLFSELVRTALVKLGYSSSEALAAKSVIQLKNWKPLTLNQITTSPEATVGDILGELTTVATLRICVYSRPKIQSDDVKEKLLRVLLAESQNVLVTSGCPIDQSVLMALTKGDAEYDISEEIRNKFDQWYLQQQQQDIRHSVVTQPSEPITVSGSPPHTPQTLETATPRSEGRTRMRASFHSELELPLLNHWFAENQHPTRLHVRKYVHVLNSLEYRQNGKPLDVNNVIYWFKNARAAYRRTEQKCCCESNGIRIPCTNGSGKSRSLAFEPNNCRLPNENGSEMFSGGESHSESQVTSSDDDSDNVQAQDRSSRRRHRNHSLVSDLEHGEPQVELGNNEDSRGSSSEHSIKSIDNDDEVEVMEELSTDVDEPGISEGMQQNKGVTGSESLVSTASEADRQESRAIPGRRVSERVEERRKRNRIFIDPVSEIPRLEKWFSKDTYPSRKQIMRFTQKLNSMQYRQKYPKLEPKSIRLWFKNRRAKCKRLNITANL